MRGEVTDRHRLIARQIVREGKPIRKVLREAGYTPTQADKGMKRIAHTKGLREAVQDELDRWAKQASQILRVAVPRKRAEMIRARLALNIARGQDRAVQSCKLLGNDREVNMFEPESQINLNHIINNCPAQFKEMFFGSVAEEGEEPGLGGNSQLARAENLGEATVIDADDVSEETVGTGEELKAET